MKKSKHRSPTPEQARVLTKHGLKPHLYVVVQDYPKSMIVRSIIDYNDVKLLQK